jgi:DNA processing protein
VKIITVFDDDYPQDLLHISQTPFIIYVRWTLDNSQKFSVVWTRKISSYWKKIIQNIIPDISKYFIIVSWWAAWCDTLAHKMCIESWNKTLSIIWTGIDQDYPTNNKWLYDNIVEKGGGVLSIFPIWEVWNPYNFPIRNELVAGLSVGTLVVEAQSKSGTIITSNQCLDLWKDLFAVPWDIYLSNSSGCNELIKKWSAKLTTNSVDILEEYNIWWKNNTPSSSNKVNVKFSDDIEKNIYNLLLTEKYNINEISKNIWVDVRTLAFKLSMLEISWIIKKSLSWDYEIQ